MSYLSKNGYVLRKENLTPTELTLLKKELVGKPLQDDKYATANNTFPLYIETKNKLYIPKMYGISKFGFPKDTLDNYEGKSWEHDIPFLGNLYPIQLTSGDILIKTCQEQGGGILSLATGFGKSITCLYALSKLKRKTIIILNKITLLKQWEMEIRRFLPDANIGIIQGQKKIDVDDKDIVLTMLQSLSRIDYPKELFQDFGVVVSDEVHNTGSKVFSKALGKLCCKYTIGLTATPTRADGCEYIYKWFLGDIVYKSHSQRSGNHPIIRSLSINSSEYKEIVSVNKFTGQTQLQFTSMLSELISLEKRNRLIIELIKSCAQEKRRILVLSERRTHLEYIKRTLDKDNTITFTSGLFLGSMKIQDLERSKACDCILATIAAFGEGVSERDLDTLILITPKKFVGHLKNKTKNESGKLEQIVGRIFRKDHVNNHPLIIDLQDNFSVYKHQSAGRNVFYKYHFKSVKFEHQTIDLDQYTIDEINVSCISTKKTQELFDKEDLDIGLNFDSCVIHDN